MHKFAFNCKREFLEFFLFFFLFLYIPVNSLHFDMTIALDWNGK